MKVVVYKPDKAMNFTTITGSQHAQSVVIIIANLRNKKIIFLLNFLFFYAIFVAFFTGVKNGKNDQQLKMSIYR